MTRLSMKTIREMNEKDLQDRIQETQNELVKLKMEGAKGTLRKNSGKIKPLKRDIARMMTRLTEVKK